MQTLYGSGEQSRADIARKTGLTRVTISDLVAELMDTNLVLELGQRQGLRPGKPATLLDINRSAFQIIGLDLSGDTVLRGAVLSLDGVVLERAEVPLAGSTGKDATAKVIKLAEMLVRRTRIPLLGIGVGSPGIVDVTGTVLSAPNLGWDHEHLEETLAARFGIPVIVGNDARAAVLAEHSFDSAQSDIMVVRIGHGVGAGMLLNGNLLFGSQFAAGEIGHVVVDSVDGIKCVCGKIGCLETWLAIPRLEARIEAAEARGGFREPILREAGRHLGVALAPIVGMLNISEIVLSGPPQLLEGPLFGSAIETLRERTMAELHSGLIFRMTRLGEDIVLRGAAVMVLSAQLGVS